MLLIFLVLLLYCWTPVEPVCGPVEEGQSTTLTCDVNTAGECTGFVMTWKAEAAGDATVVRCALTDCGGSFMSNFPTTINSTRSTLTIPSVTRTDPFNMETKWTCNSCEKGSRTVCEKLQVYAKPQNSTCTVNENTGPGGIMSVTVTCSTTKVYPQAKCSFYRTKNGGNSVKITETPVYSHTTIPATASTPVYYRSRCSVSVPVEELGEGTHSFMGYIYPDVTGREHLMNVITTDKTVTLSFPQVSHSCTTNMEQGYFIGKSARCTCRATSDGYPRGSAQWYKGDQPVGTNGELTITYNKNDPGQVYTCEAKSALGRKPGSTLRAKFAYAPEITFTKSSRRTEFNKGDNLDFICSAQGHPQPTSVTLTRERTKEVLANVQKTLLTHTLNSLDCLDTGVYVCSGQNSQGTTSREISIGVNCAQKFSSMFFPPPKVDGVIGGKAEIDIEIYGFPEPRVTLHRIVDNADMTSSPRHEVKYTSKVAPFGFVKVTISDLVEADYTNYTLTIDNGVGDALTYSFYLNQGIYMVPLETSDIVKALETTETPRLGHYEDMDGIHNITHAPPLPRQDQNITETSENTYTTLVSANQPPGSTQYTTIPEMAQSQLTETPVASLPVTNYIELPSLAGNASNKKLHQKAYENVDMS
ncbi:neural cell adhesion molecule 1 [Elysia marginata]|uniref:Neural cell adhesion molecule 1 n=1 Tax=Elysia marginata TaxID=1093978 RepID=A0AAV4HQG2_9GAST|nr:neural cell adhesion molecule 1 [Elysia marginata]